MFLIQFSAYFWYNRLKQNSKNIIYMKMDKKKYIFEEELNMTIIDKIFGEQDGIHTTTSEDELQLEQTGTKEKKPKAEISEENTVRFTEHDRFWEGMK